MLHYIDEAGTFCWTPPEISVFAGLSIASRSFRRVEASFWEWKSKALNLSAAQEVKGSALSPEQLNAFVSWVVLAHRDFWVTVVGCDTRRTSQATAGTVVQQTADVFEAAARQLERAGKQVAARRYCRVAGWVRKRSPQNGLWLYALARTVLQTMQHGVARHLEPSDDAEFEDWQVVIDRTSVVSTPRNESYWNEWLRNRLIQETTAQPFITLKEWSERDHPLNRCPRKGRVLDMSDYFRHHVGFAESTDEVGLQMADVCATIIRRRFSDKWWLPYERLKSRIVHAADERPVLILVLDESSIRTGPPEACLRSMDDLEKEDSPHSDD